MNEVHSPVVEAHQMYRILKLYVFFPVDSSFSSVNTYINTTEIQIYNYSLGLSLMISQSIRVQPMAYKFNFVNLTQWVRA